jgi:hypothetical protein
MRLVDPRAGRFEQAIVVVILLAGFVFQQAWSIPIATIVAGLGAVLGERSPLARFWTRVVAPRRPSRAPFEALAISQRQSVLLFAGLVVATLLFAADAIALASIVAALVAVVGALGATGVVNVSTEILRRRARG